MNDKILIYKFSSDVKDSVVDVKMNHYERNHSVGRDFKEMSTGSIFIERFFHGIHIVFAAHFVSMQLKGGHKMMLTMIQEKLPKSF